MIRRAFAWCAASTLAFAACNGGGPVRSEGFDFSQWRAGDVHVHAAGDSDLKRHPRCKNAGTFLKPEECARETVRIIATAAQRAGLEWVILSEHGNWLGGVLRYDHDDGQQEWSLLRDASQSWSATSGPRLLLGQEQASYRYGAHFNTYLQTGLLPQPASDGDEVGFIERAAAAGAWGGINHPDDPRAPWSCWDGFEGKALKERTCRKDAGVSGNPPLAEAYAERWTPDGGLKAPSRGATLRAVELTNGGALPSDQTLATWDSLLRKGYLIWATGGSDAHTVSRSHAIRKPAEDKMGRSVTYAFIEEDFAGGDDFDAADPDDPVRRAIFDGRTIASTGLLAIPMLEGRMPGEAIDPGGDTTLELTVHLQTKDAQPGTITVVAAALDGACRISCKPGRVTRAITQQEWSAGKVLITIDVPSDVVRQYVRVEATATRPGGASIGAWSSPIYIQRTT